MLLSAERSVLLVVDVQERLAPAIHGVESVVEAVRKLLKASAHMGVPVLATEHYSQGIGKTVAPVAELLPPDSVIEKIHFSCAYEPGFLDRLRAMGRDQIVVTGTEAHVCVMQSTLGLLEAGFRMFLVADAVGSRVPANRDLAIERMRANGVDIVSSEMVLFEWLHRGGTPLFRDILPLIR